MIHSLGRILTDEKVITFGKDSDHILDTKMGEDAPW